MGKVDRDRAQSDSQSSALADFIEKNKGLISVLGVFAALTLFARGLPIAPLGLMLSLLFMTLATLVAFELFGRFPDAASGLRVNLFRTALLMAVLLLIVYLFLDYREVWHSWLAIPLVGVLLTAILWVVGRLGLLPAALKRRYGSSAGVSVLSLCVVVAALAVATVLAGLLSGPLNHLLDAIAARFSSPTT